VTGGSCRPSRPRRRRWWRLDLWGAEQINRHLRRNADIVAQFWTRETAATFCTGAPLPGAPVPPADRRMQADRVLVGPLRTSDAVPKLQEAESKRSRAPHESALLYEELAKRLEAAGYRGHAAVMRDRQTGALRDAGQPMKAAAVAGLPAIDALIRGDRDEARRLNGVLSHVDDVSDSGATAARQYGAVVSAAVAFAGDPLGRPEELVRSLTQSGAEALPYHASVVLFLAESLAALDPPRVQEIDDVLRSTVERLGADQWEEIGVRLRLVVAEYDQDERSELLSAALRYDVPGRLVAVIRAREARRCAQESRPDDAVEHWRNAVHFGIHNGLADEAADWLYATRSVRSRFSPPTPGIDDEHHLAQALRGTASDRQLDRVRNPSERARAAALAQRQREAVLSARQWLTDAFTTGSWASEMEAARFLGELYGDNTEPELAVEFLARSGSAKKLAQLAEQVGDRLIPVKIDRRDPWWVTDARIAFRVAQADLLPDHDAAALLDELTSLAAQGRAGELGGPIDGGQLTHRAADGACALAHRGTAEQAAAVLDLLADDVPREPNHFQYSDDAHAAACVEIAITQPPLAVPALTRLFDLAGNGV
jgi:hypothetical protein